MAVSNAVIDYNRLDASEGASTETENILDVICAPKSSNVLRISAPE